MQIYTERIRLPNKSPRDVLECYNSIVFHSDYYLCFEIVFAESFGAAAFLLFEESVEIGYIVEPTFIAHLSACEICVYEQTCGMTEPHIDDIVGERSARSCLEEPAEGSRRHSGEIGHLIQIDCSGIILRYVLLNFLHTARVALRAGICEAGCRQYMTVVGRRHIIYNLKKPQKSDKTGLWLGEIIKFRDNALDEILSERNAALSVLEKLENRFQLVFRKVILLILRRELDCDFTHIAVVYGIALFPSMLESGAYDCKVVMAESLDGIAHHTLAAGTITYEVHFHFVVAMDGVVEIHLAPVNKIEAVFLRKWSYFRDYFRHGIGMRSCKDNEKIRSASSELYFFDY